ncbi:MAG TPA: hypothetical protein VEU62_19060, partial [Bryobacterales bacterium]|nr:hypothetical protein [Bryobacterales bacterium]
MRIGLRSSIVALALAALVVPGLATAAEGTFERTLQVSGPVDLDVSTGAGGITVRAGSAGTVRVTG